MRPFRRAGTGRAAVTIEVDGEAVPAVMGESVATALLAAGRAGFGVRNKTGSLTAPYCLIGICFGCLCEVDGRPRTQTCLAPVRDGLVVRTRMEGQGEPDGT